jgi:hypothetical protein
MDMEELVELEDIGLLVADQVHFKLLLMHLHLSLLIQLW